MRLFPAVVAVTFALCPVAVAADAAPTPEAAPGHAVARVLAGDALEVRMDGRTVTLSLMGVRVAQRATDTAPGEPYAEEATLFLENLLKGERVQFEPTRPAAARGGVTPAFVYRLPDGLFVNLEVVRQGYGRMERRFPFAKADLFAAAERTARAARKGLWGPPPRSRADARLGARVAALETQLRALAERIEALEAASPKAATATVKKEPDAAKITVYLSGLSRQYHRKGCRYLGAGARALSLKEARERGYTPCRVCHPPQ